MKKLIGTALIGFLSGLLGVAAAWLWFGQGLFTQLENTATYSQPLFDRFEGTQIDNSIDGRSARLSEEPNADFIEASAASTQSVVFITTMSEYEYRTGTMFDWFFEPRTSRRTGSGSGVIFSNDGYIVTNDHVIENADKISVTHNKQTYSAELIGRDPSSDLAVLKINVTDLPAITLGNSSSIKVGEWVLAVGNPFNLASTVTAGIVSAKGRNINLLKDKFPIESFIQTDAAINPGNSGGALVNQKGELIGINTAILSRTGSYAGYGFAIPIDIVKKIFNDLVKYGEVQKAFTGADFVDLNSEFATKRGVTNLQGVVVGNIQKDGAAQKGGLKEGDIIREINGKIIEGKSQLEEYLANLYPGDEITLVLQREEKQISKNLTLLNREGKIGIIKKEVYYSDFLGAEFEVVPKVEKDLLRIESGVKVTDISGRGFISQLDIPEGFIITAINRQPINNPEELSEILSKIKGRVEIYGVDLTGRKVYYPFYLR
ncbi:MAG: serine protease Do [Cyclobacteriaceae bacterium]|jgi:serine protease Do